MKSPDNFFECFCILDDLFTKKDLSIAKTFLWFFKEHLMGNHKRTYPEIKTIANMSGCSKRTVDRFIKKYEGCVIIHRNGVCKEKKYTSNIYEFSNVFFEWLMILDYSGYLRNWTKKTRINVLKSFINDEWFLHKIIEKKGVINNEMAHGWTQKCRTIKNFFLLREDNCKVLQGAEKSFRFEQPKSKTSSLFGGSLSSLDEDFLWSGVNSAFNGINLTSKEKKDLIDVFLIKPLKTAREAYFYVNGENHAVKNAKSFIFGCARNKIISTLQRK